MAKPQTPFDPVALWRDMFSRWEESYQELARSSLGPAEFTRVLDRFVTMSLHAQQVMAQLMARSLASMPKPMAIGFNDLNARLEAMEQRLDGLVPEPKADRRGKSRSSSASRRRTVESQPAAAVSATRPARRSKKRNRSS